MADAQIYGMKRRAKINLSELGLSYGIIASKVGRSRMHVWRILHEEGVFSEDTKAKVLQIVERAKLKKAA